MVFSFISETEYEEELKYGWYAHKVFDENGNIK